MTIHKHLASNKWNKLSLVEQMANVGAEVSRTINWTGRSATDAGLSFERALELINLTLEDPKNNTRLKEIARTKEMFTNWYLGNAVYTISSENWQKYFLHFAIASRLKK